MRESIADMFSHALFELEQVTDLGGSKHGYGTWKDINNPSLQHNSNCASMFRHLAEVQTGVQYDPESGVDPLLHLAWRALAAYECKARAKTLHAYESL